MNLHSLVGQPVVALRSHEVDVMVHESIEVSLVGAVKLGREIARRTHTPSIVRGVNSFSKLELDTGEEVSAWELLSEEECTAIDKARADYTNLLEQLADYTYSYPPTNAVSSDLRRYDEEVAHAQASYVNEVLLAVYRVYRREVVENVCTL